MPYEPLHHKYRPQTFKDLVGQETIAQTLSNALRQEKIAPAYLFTGPRGTGKTSSARIMAKSLNCLASEKPTPDPCGKCEVCKAIAVGSALDVMEIDAASNTGVDNIREIIERSRFAPVQCRYKIYAIDECHMLSTAAFNALLKTLEEPPPRVVFILATTDPQRVLSTIISRCQRFDYRRIPLPEMTAHLKYIAETENIAIATDALTLIAQIANGGLRDAESLLDQLSLLPETISVAKVWDLVGAVPEQDLLKLLQLINSSDSMGVLQQCRSLLDRGREPLVVLQNLASFYLNLLIAKTAPQRLDLTAVTQTCWQQLCSEAADWDVATILRGQQQLKEAETQLKQTTQPRLWLEVTLLGLLPEVKAIASATATVVQPAVVTARNSEVETQVRPSVATSNNTISADRGTSEKNAVEKPLETEPEQPVTHEPNRNFESHTAPTTKSTSIEPASVNPPSDINANREIWHKVVNCLQPPTTQALLKQQCHLVSFDGSSAIVGISSAKLQKLNQGKVPNIEAAFAKVCQRQIKVQLEVAGSQDSSSDNIAPPPNKSTVPVRPSSDLPATPTVVEFQTSESTRFDRSPKSPTVPQNQPAENNPEFKPRSATSRSFDAHDDGFNRGDRSQLAVSKRAIEPTVDEASSASIMPATIELDSLLEITTESQIPENEQQLQQAIDNLTLSFEGELVQLADVDKDLETTATSESPSTTNQIDFNRPKAEDYKDEW